MQTLVIDTSYGSTVGVVGHEPIVETDSRTHVEKLCKLFLILLMK